MTTRTYLVISGTIFGIVSIFHLLRVVNSWVLVLGEWSVPMWVSWFIMSKGTPYWGRHWWLMWPQMFLNQAP